MVSFKDPHFFYIYFKKFRQEIKVLTLQDFFWEFFQGFSQLRIFQQYLLTYSQKFCTGSNLNFLSFFFQRVPGNLAEHHLTKRHQVDRHLDERVICSEAVWPKMTLISAPYMSYFVQTLSDKWPFRQNGVRPNYLNSGISMKEIGYEAHISSRTI